MPPGRIALEMHGLLDTEHLTDAEYAAARNRIERVQDAADRAQAYIAARGLDPRLYLPGNIWGELVPAEPQRFRTDYPAIDLMRLHAAFSGYQMALLDRMDPGRAYAFPKETDPQECWPGSRRWRIPRRSGRRSARGSTRLPVCSPSWARTE